MDLLTATTPSTDNNVPEDVLMLLGRVADAFDNPSSRDTDKELEFIVNVVKTRQPRNSCQNGGTLHDEMRMHVLHDSPFDVSFDEDIGLEDFDIRELASSYPPVSRRHRPPKPRSYSERIFREDDATRNVTKMLLTNSPLDRLDRLARNELKKTGWFERLDQWAVVEMGLQGLPTPPKTQVKSTLMSDSVAVLSAFSITETSERLSARASTNPTTRNGQQKSPRTPRSPRRPGIFSAHPPTSSGGDCGLDNQRQGYSDKGERLTSMRSPVYSQDSQDLDPYLVDFSPLSYSDSTAATPIRTRLQIGPSEPRQTRGRFGQVVRNFVKRMLPPSSGSGLPNCITRTRQLVSVKDSHRGTASSARTSPVDGTPHSNVSAESGWTFASVSSGADPPVQPCLDYQGTKRWSGLWH